MFLLFDSIIFDLNSYFGYSAMLAIVICYAARYAHVTVPSGRRGVSFFLWEQMYTSSSTLIKKIKPFVCNYIGMPW